MKNDALQNLTKAFSATSSNRITTSKKRGRKRKAKEVQTKPFSIRLTHREREALEAMAGSQGLGIFIREELLGDKIKKRKHYRKPKINDQKVALVLSALGESRLSANLNQLAKHANIGSLEFDETTEIKLLEACEAVISMRAVLLNALGHRA